MAIQDQSVLSISLPEVENILSFVRSRFNGELTPDGVPAHITLLYPWMPPVQIDEDVLNELTSLFGGFSSFDFSLELGWFGREVLLLVPKDSTPFINLTKAIIGRWPEFKYYGGDYDKIEPHVTLAYGDDSSLSKLAIEVAKQIPVQARASMIDLSIGQPGKMITSSKLFLGSHKQEVM